MAMALRRAALEIVLNNLEDDLGKLFVPMMEDLMDMHCVALTDGYRARLRRIARKHKATLDQKVAEWVPLVARRNIIKSELAARLTADYLGDTVMSDRDDPESDFYRYTGGDFDMRHCKTEDLEAEHEIIYDKIQDLGDYFGFTFDGYDSDDPDAASQSIAFPTLEGWAALS